jgi:hypothetical protein
MDAKQRIRTLAWGSLSLALALQLSEFWFVGMVNPNLKGEAFDLWSALPGVYLGLCLWGGIFFTLRPFIPGDAPTGPR